MRFNPCLTTPATTTPATPRQPLVIGSRIHCILYGGSDGIIYNIKGQQRPETVGTLGAGVVVTGGMAEFDIVFTGERAHLSTVSEALVQGSVQWRILDGIASAEEITEALHLANQRKDKLQAEATEKTTKRNAERAELPKQYPFLTTVAKSGKSSHAQGSANLKTELSRAFPGVKFSVKSDSYSGGDSISVRWSAGPTTKQVEAISGKYQEGSFDGMTDSYDYNHDNVWPDVFGGAKYVSESRDFPFTTREQIGRGIAALRGKDYDGNDYDLQREVGELLSRTAFPLGAQFKAVERTPENERGTFDWCRIVFDLPAPIETAAVKANGATLIPTKHTKTGAPLWVVQLADRVDKTEYQRINGLCREHGGYYSSFRGNGAVPGFTFKVQTAAEAFLAELSGASVTAPATIPTVPPVAPVTPPPVVVESPIVPRIIPQIAPMAGFSPLGMKPANLGNCSISQTEPKTLSGQAVPAWRQRATRR